MGIEFVQTVPLGAVLAVQGLQWATGCRTNVGLGSGLRGEVAWSPVALKHQEKVRVGGQCEALEAGWGLQVGLGGRVGV